jgi:carbon monoxide dehydrogenase subunit G
MIVYRYQLWLAADKVFPVPPIEATASVAAQPEDVFDFLSDLENHWRLVDRFVEVPELNADGALVRLRGPLGVRRTVRTRVTETRRPRLIVGTAELRGSTCARVTWTLARAAST